MYGVSYIIGFVVLSVTLTTYTVVNCKTKSVSIRLEQSNPYQDSTKWQYIAHYFTVFTLCIYIVFALNSILNEWAYAGMLDESFSCDVLGKIALLMYHIANYTLYVVLMAYWKHLYSGSEFQSECTKWTQIAMWFLMAVQLIYAFYFDLNFVEATTSTNAHRHCQDIDIDTFPELFGIIQVVLDLVLSALFLMMFFIPFQSVMHYGPHSAATFDHETVVLIPKLFLLATVMVISHVVIVGLAIWVNMLWLINYDILVNGVCVMLMALPFHPTYVVVCGCFDKCIQRRFDAMSPRTIKEKNELLSDQVDDDDEYATTPEAALV